MIEVVSVTSDFGTVVLCAPYLAEGVTMQYQDGGNISNCHNYVMCYTIAILSSQP